MTMDQTMVGRHTSTLVSFWTWEDIIGQSPANILHLMETLYHQL